MEYIAGIIVESKDWTIGEPAVTHVPLFHLAGSTRAARIRIDLFMMGVVEFICLIDEYAEVLDVARGALFGTRQVFEGCDGLFRAEIDDEQMG